MPWGNVNKVPNCYKILLALMNRVIFSSFILLYLLTIASFLTIYSADASGTIYTSQTYGGEGDEYCHSIIQTTEGGYALVGSTTSFDADYYDFWLVKTDASGNHEWNQTYGGLHYDQANSVIQTVDGGYVLVGETLSFGAGGTDFWLVKTDASGNHEWNQTYGGPSFDDARSVVQTVDGGYAIAGDTYPTSVGNSDFWLVKTDASGNHEWNQTYGGQTLEKAHSMIQTVDGGYAIAGNTDSLGIGGWDFLFVKTDQNGIIPEFPSTILLSLFTAVTLMAVLIHRIKRTSIPNIKAM
jgi:hypothetical protein